jgi:ribonuclease R
MVPPGDAGDAEEGDVVVVRYVSYGDGKLSPVGEVEDVLGKLDDPGVDILAVAHSYGLMLDFPREVMQAAQEAASRGMDEPGPHRVDRTDLMVFTIDPVDAKDHDDALSIHPLDDGNWEVGIHIADVSHFVPEGGVVDQEALARGTSVYLVDRTIPMLPEQLSGDVCSLREGVDRFALSLFVELDREGDIHGHRFERTVVRCRHGLGYEEAQEVLDGRGSVDPGIDDSLWLLDDLARKIREKRMARGALDLDLPEAKVVLDEEGVPQDIQRKERLEAHRLVEDFMILANELVARECDAREIPVLYRIHEPPERERAQELAEFLQGLGHRLPRRRKLAPNDVQTLLEAVKGRPDEHLVSNVVLRSLKRAVYDRENLGHFGLASSAYLHFTSPIRRYPDLVVHREVARTLVAGGAPRSRDPDELQSVADQASAREQAAAEAERDSVALKKVEFMERHLGGEFEGRVAGVQAFGFFVTLDDFFVDGLVHVNSLDDDYYRLREDAYALVGDRGGRRFQLGDRVRVRVTRVDKEARHVDFLLLEKLRPTHAEGLT